MKKKDIKPKRKLKKKFVIMILIFFIVLSIFSLYKVVLWKIDNNKTKEQVEEIKETTKIEEVKEEEQEII